MTLSTSPVATILFATLLLALPCLAKDKPKPADEEAAPAATAVDQEAKAKPESEESDHTEPAITHGNLISPDGSEFAYTATAGVIDLKDDKQETTGSVFHVAYTSKEPDASRPVVFCFNGGPGSAAVWLHMGALGPKRINLPGKGTQPGSPPFKLVANPHTILPLADLVFVDPISTGYSRPKTKENKKDFHGFSEDIESMGEFIRLWITNNGRWGSPKILLGESYGALRVAGLAGYLQDRHGMYLNGVVLLSGIIDFRTISSRGGNDLPYSAFLPSIAATAYYHGKLGREAGPDLETVVRRAQDFADTDYASALQAGSRLSPELRHAVCEELSLLTSIPYGVIDKADLRIDPTFFRKQLLLTTSEVIGRFDGRVTLPARDALRSSASFDPSWDVTYGAYATGMNRYLRDTLEYESELPYKVIGSVHPWGYDEFENAFVNSTDDLRNAMVSNPKLKLLVNCGYYDLATPPAGIEYSIAQMKLPREVRNNIRYAYYQGGHMFYTNPEALKKLRTDLETFLAAAAPATPKAKVKATPKGEEETNDNTEEE